MKKFFNKIILVSLFLCATMHSLHLEAYSHDSLRGSQKDFRYHAMKEIDFLGEVLKQIYAPMEWKEKQLGIVLQKEIDRIKIKLCKQKNLNLDFYRNLITELVNNLKDFHVRLRFFSTEESNLPFIIKKVDEGYCFAFIDQIKKPEGFPFEVGDYILTMNGKSVEEELAYLANSYQAGFSNPAECNLTNRKKEYGQQVPRGEITITGMKFDSLEEIKTTVKWEYTPDVYKLGQPFSLPKIDKKVVCDKFVKGNLKGVISELGELKFSQVHSDITYKVFHTKDDVKVATVRLPHFKGKLEEADFFKEMMWRCEAESDILVIDLTHNYGGDIFYAYSLLQALASKDLVLPTHNIALIEQFLEEYLGFIVLSAKTKDLEVLRAIFRNKLKGYYLYDEDIINWKTFSIGMLDDYKLGKKFSKSVHLCGIETIKKDPIVCYTKPIIVLLDGSSFSCSEFFSLILQDSGRATIVGEKTGGAAGYPYPLSWPSKLGLKDLMVTVSIATRNNGEPLENIGVTPDFELTTTRRDLMENYADYASKLLDIINQLVKK